VLGGVSTRCDEVSRWEDERPVPAANGWPSWRDGR
jgi:hypothetical protein